MSSVTTPAGRRERRSVDSEVSGEFAHQATYLVVLILLSLFAWAPLLYPGYLQVHSGFLPIFNLADLAASSNRLQWLPTIGVTPDLLRGEGPLAYWLALLLRPLAGDAGAVKGVFALSFIAAGLGVYAWTRRAISDIISEHDIIIRAGVLAAVVMMLWPPLLATVYVRGALAEALFIGLAPWALWAVSAVRCQVSRSPGAERSGSVRCQVSGVGSQVPESTGQGVGGAQSRSGVERMWLDLVACAVIAMALFWTQTGLALWAMVVLVAWSAWPGATGKSRLAVGGAVLAGSAIGFGLLWLLHGGQTATASPPVDLAAHAVYPYQLFSPAWSFGISTPDWKGDLPLQLGLAALALAMLTVILGAGRSRADDRQAGGLSPRVSIRSVFGFSIVVGFILILLTTPFTRPLWRALPALANTLTYPWQLFALIGPLLALLAGAVVVIERRLALLPMWAGLVVFVLLSSTSYLSPRFTPIDPGPAPAGLFGNNQVTLLAAAASFAPESAASADESATLLPSPSTPLTVTLAWQAMQPIDADYNLFVHVLDEAGNKVAQWDGQPQRGQEPYPMTQWPVGEIVPATIRLELSPEQAASVRHVVIGLYDWQTGSRLSVGNDDKVMIPIPSAANSEVAQ